MESLNIAIIGSRGVGKSSFVQRVLGLSRPPISDSSSLRIVIDNRNYGVTLLELDLEHFDMPPDRPIQWPRQINGHMLPRVDGALILYDVTNKDTTVDLPRTLSTSASLSLPISLSLSTWCWCCPWAGCIANRAFASTLPPAIVLTRPRCNSRFDSLQPALDPRGVQVRRGRQRAPDRRRRHGQSGPVQGVCGQLQHLVQ